MEKQNVLHILSVFVFLALVIQHTMQMRRIVICDLLGCAVFFRLISQTA
jgi:hypothetical protein